jgi:adenosylhomocysteinase
MPVLAAVRERLIASGALKGVKVGMALHVEAKTGVLALSLKEAGAKVRLASCNPLSTDDSVARALREHHKLEVFARKGEERDEYYSNLHKVLDLEPDYVVDDGADLIFLLHSERRQLLEGVKGGNEETTTGVTRLRAMAAEGALRFPVIAVNDAYMKYLFDNRYGTGQSTMDGIMTATNLLIAGKRFVVAGYGWVGRGIALRAKGMGAQVVVTEVDPIRALEARLDGFEVTTMTEAIREADFVVSATGVKDVVRSEHLAVAKDGCILANSGHFNNEVSREALLASCKGHRKVREFVEEFVLADGRKVYLLGEGRLINLVAGQGHPAEIMDMSFSVQALALLYHLRHPGELPPGVHILPREVDEEVARIKLSAMGISIDELTEEQRRYVKGWREGT